MNTFGTDDMEWFCATEAILNTLFNVKTRNQPEYARTIIQQLTKKLYDQHSKTTHINLDEEAKAQDEDGMRSSTPLRNDINDMHYAQLFFVVGHIAIKMLTYVEHLDSELKKSGNNAAGAEIVQAAKKGKKNEEVSEEGKQPDDELDQIGGGKEAEIEQYS